MGVLLGMMSQQNTQEREKQHKTKILPVEFKVQEDILSPGSEWSKPLVPAGRRISEFKAGQPAWSILLS